MTGKSLIAGVGLLLLAGWTHGDGGYWPEPAVAALPKVPVQRAMIVYRNGVETLVVESTYETPSPSVGWVIPLPSEPTKLDVADAGMLKSLAMCIQPRIIHDLQGNLKTLLHIVVLIALLAGVVILTRDRKSRATGVLLLVVLYLFVWSLLFSALGTAGVSLGGGQGVMVASTQRVGNYEVSVLRAQSAGDLSAWLKGQGLKTLDETSEAVVEDYIGRKWCFVVAKLRQEGGGEATPHPIAATFAVDRPVYPMKLTGLAGSPTKVELFVVAGEMAGAEGFRRAAADRYVLSDAGSQDTQPDYQGKTFRLVIGSPDVQAFLWNGCVMTRLNGDLTPEQMGRDVEIGLSELEPYRDTFFSARGRRDLVTIVLLVGAAASLLVLMVICRGRRKPTVREWKTLGTLAAAVVVVAALVWVSVEVVAVQSGRALHPAFVYNRLRMFELAVIQMAQDGVLHAEMSEDELAHFPQVAVEKNYLISEKWTRNPFTGQEMIYERSPGNFSTRKIGDEVYLCFYDGSCRERRVELPRREKDKSE